MSEAEWEGRVASNPMAVGQLRTGIAPLREGSGTRRKGGIPRGTTELPDSIGLLKPHHFHSKTCVIKCAEFVD